MEFSKLLRTLRKRKGMTQFELAARTGLSRSRLNNYENGLREPDLETLCFLSDFFNVTTDFLLGRGDMSISTEEENNSAEDIANNCIEMLTHEVEELNEVIIHLKAKLYDYMERG